MGGEGKSVNAQVPKREERVIGKGYEGGREEEGGEQGIEQGITDLGNFDGRLKGVDLGSGLHVCCLHDTSARYLRKRGK